VSSGCAFSQYLVYNVLDFCLIDGGSSFHADDGSWVVTESDLGCHGHGTTWFVFDVASPVSLEAGAGEVLAREHCVIVSYERNIYSRQQLRFSFQCAHPAVAIETKRDLPNHTRTLHR